MWARWCSQNAKHPYPTPHLFVIGDSSPAHLTLMNPDTDYKPPFQTENTGPSNSISFRALSSRNYKATPAGMLLMFDVMH